MCAQCRYMIWSRNKERCQCFKGKSAKNILRPQHILSHQFRPNFKPVFSNLMRPDMIPTKVSPFGGHLCNTLGQLLLMMQAQILLYERPRTKTEACVLVTHYRLKKSYQPQHFDLPVPISFVWIPVCGEDIIPPLSGIISADWWQVEIIFPALFHLWKHTERLYPF